MFGVILRKSGTFMLETRRSVAIAGLLALLCLQSAIARKKPAAPAVDERARAIQALNRLTFGPRPGDVDRVVGIGVDKWIGMQLHPESIDDHALDGRLEGFRTLRMSPNELVENFPPQARVREIANGRATLPRDPRLRAIYELQLERFRERQQKGADADQNSPNIPDPVSDDERSQLLDTPAQYRVSALLKLPAEQEQAFLANLKGGA